MNKNTKKSDKDLLIALVLCGIFGLQPILFTVRYYLKNKDVPPDKIDVHNSLSMLVWGQDQLLHTLIYQIIPTSGGVLLLVGFIIWNHRRKKRLSDDYNHDA